MSQTKPSPQQQQQQHQVSFGQHKNVHKISNQISQKKRQWIFTHEIHTVKWKIK